MGNSVDILVNPGDSWRYARKAIMTYLGDTRGILKYKALLVYSETPGRM